MGKVTGFLEYERLEEAHEAPAQRKQHYREFFRHLTDEQAGIQGARCMDCGIPFCMQGCPVNNVIPDFNDLVYRQDWKNAIETLHSTNNFPEFTGRICPAPCEEACVLRIIEDPVGIKSIEHAIIDKAWQEGWVPPLPPAHKTGRKVAVIGSGPAGLACAQQLARAGHDVVVFEKNDRIGGLLRYGIPDFKMEKSIIERRLEQMRAEGVEFRVNHVVGGVPVGAGNAQARRVDARKLAAEYDAVVLAGGAEQPRDLPVPGRALDGIEFAMDFLPLQNRRVAGDAGVRELSAKGKHVVIIGGGDTGSDCVGTSNRHGAEIGHPVRVAADAARCRQESGVAVLAAAAAHLLFARGGLRARLVGRHQGVHRWDGRNEVKALKVVRLEWNDGKMSEVPGSEFTLPADLVLLAMGFVSPYASVLEAFGAEKDARGNAKATTDGAGCYATSAPKVFAAGDMRRGQSLVVWAIREGRQCARAVDEFLMGTSQLPR